MKTRVHELHPILVHTPLAMLPSAVIVDLAAVLKIYDDPTFCVMSPLTISAWGRKR